MADLEAGRELDALAVLWKIADGLNNPSADDILFALDEAGFAVVRQDRHMCSGTDEQHTLCWNCVEYASTALGRGYSLRTDDKWDDPKYHTSICRELRAALKAVSYDG